MDFPYYPKMSYSEESRGSLPGGSWVALEKIHGAQLVVAVDRNGQVLFGKRKEWLADDEAFFGWQLLRARLSVALKGLREILGAPLVSYGELFGGSYPHPEVAAAPGMEPVQTGVWYSPRIHYRVFDLRVGLDQFLSYSQLHQVLPQVGLKAPPLLGQGSLNKLLALPVEFATRVPAELGLPELSGNLAEGLVLRPDAPSLTRLKRKIPQFSEVRFDESAAWDGDRPLSLAELQDWARRLVNPARLASAASKVGRQAEAVLQEVILDVLVDLEAAFPGAYRHHADQEEALRQAIEERALEIQG